MVGIDLISWWCMKQVLRGLCVVALLAASSAAVASEYHGQVMFGGLPVPGATVTVTQGGKRSVVVTDTQGFYSFPDLADGAGTIDVEMTGFAAIKQEVTIAANGAAGKWELKLLTLAQIRAVAKPVVVATVAAPQGKSAPAKPGEPAKPQDNNAPAMAPAPPSSDESAQQASDGLLINGSVNNAATSPFRVGLRSSRFR